MNLEDENNKMNHWCFRTQVTTIILNLIWILGLYLIIRQANSILVLYKIKTDQDYQNCIGLNWWIFSVRNNLATNYNM